ncbi:MAG: hypothetical protein QOJ42_5943, partial [Acidobacteriaceae bacterium]|nr:hypothetical protein [Acidobacteriaceae bacterium]
LLHLLRIIQAHDAAGIINQQVKMLQKVLAENAVHPRIADLYLPEVVDQQQRVLHSIAARLQQVQARIRCACRNPRPVTLVSPSSFRFKSAASAGSTVVTCAAVSSTKS